MRRVQVLKIFRSDTDVVIVDVQIIVLDARPQGSFGSLSKKDYINTAITIMSIIVTLINMLI